MPFEALFVPSAFRDAVSDEAWLRALLETERALAAAQAKVGVISQEAAAAVVAACTEHFDAAAVRGIAVLGDLADDLVGERRDGGDVLLHDVGHPLVLGQVEQRHVGGGGPRVGSR